MIYLYDIHLSMSIVTLCTRIMAHFYKSEQGQDKFTDDSYSYTKDKVYFYKAYISLFTFL